MTAVRWKPHVTVAALIAHEGRFLLVEERTAHGLQLNNPAGHLERGESLVQACVREVLEETAHHFTPEALVGVYMASSPAPQAGAPEVTYVRFAFTGRLGDKVPDRVLDAGIVRTVWLTADEVRASAARHRSPLVLLGVEDHLAGRRLPLEAIYTDPSVLHAAG